MLAPKLSELGDALARCHVMRMMDLLEMEVLADTSMSSNGGGTANFTSRESWRMRSEEASLRSLSQLILDASFLASLRTSYQSHVMVRDLEDEAGAAAVGATVKAVETSPFRDVDTSELFDLSAPHALVVSKCSKKQPSATEVIDELLEKCVPSDRDTASQRTLLLLASRQFRTVLWLWQRYVVLSPSPPKWKGNIVAVLRTFIDVHRARVKDLILNYNVAQGRRGEWTSSADKASKLPFVWSSEHAKKWSDNNSLVVGMQRRARGTLARRKYDQILVKKRTDGKLSKYHRLQQQLMPTSLRYLQQTQPTAHQYVELVSRIEREQSRLEEFYGTEEKIFEQQWNAYLRKMTKFYLNECPLDVDWIAQQSPAPDGEKGASLYINVKTGKQQTEHPNTLKIVAAKNRQWLKATKERETRLQAARDSTEELNKMKSLLVTLERQLSESLFL